MKRSALGCQIALSVFIGMSFPQQLLAHRPIFTEDAAAHPETAIQMTDPDISQVFYREVAEKKPQIWLTFSVPKDFDLFIQIGVPVIDRLKDFRPATVVVGPGLPEKNPPFNLPKGMGAKVFPTNEVEKPRFFHEPFTNTDSWILRSETIRLASPGRYYLVAFSPQGQTGKLWLSVGKKESFSTDDFKQFSTWAQRIQDFHEVKKK
jgi:hypothetical protein